MADLLDVLQSLQKTPVPNLLVMGGFLLLLLAFVGRIGAIIELPRRRQKWAGGVGVVLLILGIGLFVTPADSEPPAVPASEALTATAVPATSTITPTAPVTSTPIPSSTPTETVAPPPTDTPTPVATPTVPTPVACEPEFNLGHVVNLSIPAQVAGTATDGKASFTNKQFSDVSPGDRLTIHIEFPDRLVVKDTPDFVDLNISGERVAISSMSTGSEPVVISQGSLDLKWSNGGIRSGNAAEGTVDGFWINLINANTPQPGQTLSCLTVSFVVPGEVLSNPIRPNQTIEVSTVSWRNMSSPAQ